MASLRGGMRVAPLETVRIENFRGVRSTEIALHPNVTVFIGSNAAGKTTVLDALAVGLGAVLARVPKVAGRAFARSGDIRVPWKNRADVGEKRGVECPFARVQVTTTTGLRWDVTRFRSELDRGCASTPLGTKALHDAIDPGIKAALDASPGIATEPIPLVAAYGTERAVVGVPLRERDFGTDFRRFGGLDQSLAATTRFKKVFEWFLVMEDEERREREARRDFSFLLSQLEWVRRAVGKADLPCKNPRVEVHPIRMLIDFEHERSEAEPLDVNALSDGYRTHFSLVVDLARRMVQLNPSLDLNDPVRGTNSEAVVLIDEIDLHLDPRWQARVVGGLVAAFPNAQFVLTTHSEQVVGSVMADCVRKLVWGDGEVLVEPVPFAQGSTGERILIDLMGGPERVPGPVTELLGAYLTVMESGGGETEIGLVQWRELEAALPRDPALRGADLEMQRRELMEKLKGSSK